MQQISYCLDDITICKFYTLPHIRRVVTSVEIVDDTVDVWSTSVVITVVVTPSAEQPTTNRSLASKSGCLVNRMVISMTFGKSTNVVTSRQTHCFSSVLGLVKRI